MDSETVKGKVSELMKTCDCGSGKMAGMCCKQGESKAIAGEMCPCGSGKTVGECCLKNPDAHQSM